MVPATTGGGLKSRVEDTLKRIPGPDGQNLRVVERPGPSLKQLLTKSNPFQREGCSRPHCPWGGQDCKEKCFKESIGYNIRCRRCISTEIPSTVYVGESARSAYTRFRGHIQDLKGSMKNPRTKSWMGDHIREVHGGSWDSKDPHEEWEMSLEGTFRKPLDRQVN